MNGNIDRKIRNGRRGEGINCLPLLSNWPADYGTLYSPRGRLRSPYPVEMKTLRASRESSPNGIFTSGS